MNTSSKRCAQIRPILSSALIATMLVSAFGIATRTASADGGTQSTRQLISAGTNAGLQSTAEGVDGFQNPEFPSGRTETEGNGPPVNRSFASKHGPKHLNASPPVVSPSPVSASGGELGAHFQGLNFRQQRLANGGNQFSLEPPDQGLCVGNGFVLETINDVLRAFNSSDGTPAGGVVDQNTFYGYPPAIVRPSTFGPEITDPSCLYDPDVQRWFHVALTLDRVGTTSALSGKNHLDIAVSDTSDPRLTWHIYRLPVQDDGTDGTPDHGCSGTPDGSGHGPCVGDYPHIGADATGFYITTNEYSFFGPEFKYANIYAMSKRALASGVASPTVVQFANTFVDKASTPGFTVWPAVAPNSQYASDNGGTEFFLSSMAAEEAGNVLGYDNRLGLWALFNTSSLDTTSPNLALSSRSIGSETYGIPPKAEQKPGDIPLGQCINDTTIVTPFGTGCWNLFFLTEPAHDEVLSHLDTNDTRMQQTVYANGLVWGALDTILSVNGQEKAGIAWFAVQPSIIGNGNGLKVGPQSKVVMQGYLAVANNNVSYPALAVLPSGKGAMAFTLVGNDYYPAAAYTLLDSATGVGDVRVAGAGIGPSDGFTSYKAFVGDPPRTRWGDYGAAVYDGNSIWIASEYIAQTCTLAQYLTGAIGSCGGTRASLGNWSTHVSKVTP